MFTGGNLTLFGLAVFVVHVLGILNAAHAVTNVRSSQSAIAWSISLITFPWLTIPLYWVLGQRKFRGYTEIHRAAYGKYRDRVRQAYRQVLAYAASPREPLSALDKLARTLTEIPFISGNKTQLLIDGKQTYHSMLEAIQSAQHYILLQSYIIRADQAGRSFQQALIEKAQQGVQICVLYDEIGSQGLTRPYVQTLQQYGIQVTAFNTTKGWGNHFQLNFRNHRKILIVDGHTAFTGGLNIGDEYLGKHPRLGPWRDTHLKLQGPAVQCLQLVFLKDWYWAVETLPETDWDVKPALECDETLLVLPTGPADIRQTCTLFFGSIINLAHTRLWIASPYFVPDEPTLAALKMAALRGVDVRIILPDRADHLFVYLCSFSYYAEMKIHGIQFYRYKTGFMHQKVILVDEVVAGVGTVNLDNRSFHLNFEVMVFGSDRTFVRSVDEMLQADLANCYCVDWSDYDSRPFWFKLAVRIARLLAPLQ